MTSPIAASRPSTSMNRRPGRPKSSQSFPRAGASLRDEFAFEFLAFARFLGSVSAGAELQVHEAIASALAEPNRTDTLVFSISSGLWPSSDLHPVLSCCVEKLTVTVCHWLEESSNASSVC